MTALRAINGHAAHVFKTHVMNLAKERNITTVPELTEAIYGRRYVSSVHPILTGTTHLSELMAERWSQALGVSPEHLLEANAPVKTALGRAEKRKYHSLKRPATSALNRHVRELLAVRGLTFRAFATALKMKNPSTVWAILVGKTKLTSSMATRWSAVLDVSADGLLAMNQGGEEPVHDAPAHTLTVPPDQAKSSKIASRSSSASANELHGERFSLVVNSNGTATVKLNLDDLPLERALKLVEVLDLGSLILPGRQRAITHDRGLKKE